MGLTRGIVLNAGDCLNKDIDRVKWVARRKTNKVSSETMKWEGWLKELGLFGLKQD